MIYVLGAAIQNNKHGTKVKLIEFLVDKCNSDDLKVDSPNILKV